MGKIKASLAEISTEFQLVEPGIYDFEITDYEDVEKDGEWIATKIKSEVVAGDNEDMIGRKISDYIHITKPGEKIDPAENIGLKTIKRYFETVFGKDEIAGWDDDDYDTDLLKGKRFQAQVTIESYTPKGQTEPRQTNNFKRMDPLP